MTEPASPSSAPELDPDRSPVTPPPARTRRRPRRRTVLAAGVVAVLLVGACATWLTTGLRLHVSAGSSPWTSPAVETVGAGTPEAFLVATDPKPGDAVAVYTFVNDGLAPLTLRVPPGGQALELATVEILAGAPASPGGPPGLVTGPATDVLHVPAGTQFSVRVSEWWPCGPHAAGTWTGVDVIELDATSLGLPTTLRLPLVPMLEITTTTDRTPDPTCRP